MTCSIFEDLSRIRAGVTFSAVNFRKIVSRMMSNILEISGYP